MLNVMMCPRTILCLQHTVCSDIVNIHAQMYLDDKLTSQVTNSRGRQFTNVIIKIIMILIILLLLLIIIILLLLIIIILLLLIIILLPLLLIIFKSCKSAIPTKNVAHGAVHISKT